MLTDGCGTRLSECQSDRLAKHPRVKTRKWGKCPERGKTKIKVRVSKRTSYRKKRALTELVFRTS